MRYLLLIPLAMLTGYYLGRHQPDPATSIIGSMAGPAPECATSDIRFDGKAWRCAK